LVLLTLTICKTLKVIFAVLSMPSAQQAVWRNGGLVSSEVLFNFASVGSRPSGGGNPPLLPSRRALAAIGGRHCRKESTF
jgi:hypothetical protein